MSKKTNETKKLTNAGSVATLTVSLAFLAALGGMLLEPVGYLVHLSQFDKDVGLFSGKIWHSYFTGYDKHIIVFLLALCSLFVCFFARKRRRLGLESGAFITFVSFGCLLAAITSAASSSDGGTMEYTWATVLISSLDPDMVEFDRVMAVLYYALPIIASGLLLVLGLLLWIRAEVSSYSVECPRNEMLLSSSKPAEQPPRKDIEEAIEAVVGEKPAEAPAPEPVKEEKETLSDFGGILKESEPEPAPEPAPEPEPKPEPEPEEPPAPEKIAEPEKPAQRPKTSGVKRRPQNRGGQNRGGQNHGGHSRRPQSGAKKHSSQGTKPK